jgi:hypothetical protein
MRTQIFPMKRLGNVLILAIGWSFAAWSQPLSNSAPQSPQTSTPSQDLPKGYVPGLGEFMGRIQVTPSSGLPGMLATGSSPVIN